MWKLGLGGTQCFPKWHASDSKPTQPSSSGKAPDKTYDSTTTL